MMKCERCGASAWTTYVPSQERKRLRFITDFLGFLAIGWPSASPDEPDKVRCRNCGKVQRFKAKDDP